MNYLNEGLYGIRTFRKLVKDHCFMQVCWFLRMLRELQFQVWLICFAAEVYPIDKKNFFVSV